MALTKKLSNIGDAIRAKTGKEDKLTLEQMVTEIAAIETGGSEPAVIEALVVTENGTYTPSEGVDGFNPVTVEVPTGGYDIPAEALTFSGDCQYKFYSGGWDWFIELYGNQITTEDITSMTNMFNKSQLEAIPFSLNGKSDVKCDCKNAFGYNNKLMTVSDMNNIYFNSIESIFTSCSKLRQLPNFINCDWSYIQSYNRASLGSMFSGCYSLRNIPDSVMAELYKTADSLFYSYFPTYNGFTGCFALDEIKNLVVGTGKITTNVFYNTFNNCSRVKDITFAVQEDGTPYVRSWHSQVIDLSGNDSMKGGVGFTSLIKDNGVIYSRYINNYNSGITADKAVYDDATYQALKNDPDWFGAMIYSRYNHDSAVNTLNSLPDTSAYLATLSGKTNTIKFKGKAGSATDGGAINTLTEAEIAVAAAKGWTVTLV